MKLKKFLMTAAVVAVCLSLMAGCAQSAPPAEEAGGGAITLTDMLGRTVTLDAPAERVVALTPADCEILYAIGAGDTLVGRGEYCDYPAEIDGVQVVESAANINIEEIVALDPDVVIISRMMQTEDQAAALESAGLKVAVSYAQKIDEVYTAIELIGALTGRNDEAASLCSTMKSEFEEIKADSAGSTGTIYFEVSPLEYGLWVAGNNTFMNEIAQMYGLKNAFEDVEGWAEISQEQVIERDPDYIVTIAMYMGEGPTPVEEILSRTGWEDLKAVKNGCVLEASSDELSRPGPRLASGARSLYDAINAAQPAA